MKNLTRDCDLERNSELLFSTVIRELVDSDEVQKITKLNYSLGLRKGHRKKWSFVPKVRKMRQRLNSSVLFLISSSEIQFF